MKKYFTILLVLAAFTSISFAQMQFGLKAGANISNLIGDDAIDTETKTGFAAGVFFMYQFSTMFAIQPEIYYTMKGATEKQSISGVTVDFTYTLDYIEIPLLLKLLIPIQGSSINPAIFAGPAIGINTTAKFKAEAQGQTLEEDLEDVKSTDIGLVVGAGIGFPVGENELGFDLRYILGLTTIDDSADEFDIKNSVVNFNVYFGFSL